MKSKTNICPLLPLLLLFSFQSIFSQNHHDWELKRDKGGIKVYVRDADDSKIKELKFTTTVQASLSAVTAVLSNVEGFDDWVYASVKSETIKKVSETEVYYYTEIDFPWPFNNRDLVLHTVFWQDAKTLSINSKTTSVHWMKPEEDGLVRISKADLRWTFTPVGNGTLRVDYYLKSDPAGNIPAWLINLAADQGPLQTMVKFKEMLELEKYKNAKLAFVQEAK
jgi:ribonuclease HI